MTVCDYGCNQEAVYQFKNGKWCCSKSWNSCSVNRKKNSESGLIAQNRVDVKERISKALRKVMKEVNNRPVTRKKKSKAQKIAQNRTSVRDKKSESQKRAWKDPKIRKNIIDSVTEAMNRFGVREQISKAVKKLWKNPEYREAQKSSWDNKTDEEKEVILSKIFESCEKKPNGEEIEIDDLIQTTKPKEFKYVGDFQVWIAGKNPDWININGKKQVIEFFGNYWHGEKRRRKVHKDFSSNKEHEQNRINHFKKYGFDCLVIWEDELKDIDLLKAKILEFRG